MGKHAVSTTAAPAPVAAFSLVDIPVIRGEPRGVSAAVSEPGYVSNARQAEGRAFVILLDPLHVAAVRSLKARQVIREFVTEHMRLDPERLWATNLIAALLGITFFLLVLLAERLVVRRAPEHVG